MAPVQQVGADKSRHPASDDRDPHSCPLRIVPAPVCTRRSSLALNYGHEHVALSAGRLGPGRRRKSSSTWHASPMRRSGTRESSPPRTLDPGPPRLGSTYRLVVGVLGRRVPLEYRIEEIDRPKPGRPARRRMSVIRSTDVIEVSRRPAGGSKVTYEATLGEGCGSSCWRPLVGVALRRIGDRAAAGLHRPRWRGDRMSARLPTATPLDSQAWPTPSPRRRVVASFSRVGIGLRRRLEDWEEPPSMTGRSWS